MKRSSNNGVQRDTTDDGQEDGVAVKRRKADQSFPGTGINPDDSTTRYKCASKAAKLDELPSEILLRIITFALDELSNWNSICLVNGTLNHLMTSAKASLIQHIAEEQFSLPLILHRYLARQEKVDQEELTQLRQTKRRMDKITNLIHQDLYDGKAELKDSFCEDLFRAGLICIKAVAAYRRMSSAGDFSTFGHLLRPHEDVRCAMAYVFVHVNRFLREKTASARVDVGEERPIFYTFIGGDYLLSLDQFGTENGLTGILALMESYVPPYRRWKEEKKIFTEVLKELPTIMEYDEDRLLLRTIEANFLNVTKGVQEARTDKELAECLQTLSSSLPLSAFNAISNFCTTYSAEDVESPAKETSYNAKGDSISHVAEAIKQKIFWSSLMEAIEVAVMDPSSAFRKSFHNSVNTVNNIGRTFREAETIKLRLLERGKMIYLAPARTPRDNFDNDPAFSDS